MTQFKVGDRVRRTKPDFRTDRPWGHVFTVTGVSQGWLTEGEVGDPARWHRQSSVELVTDVAPVDTDDDTDMVAHPPHYTSDPSGVECIQITRHRNFNIGNAIKYLWRGGLKDPENPGKLIEDYRKAIWYIEDEIARLSG
jgi:hypothetical protein